MQKSDFLKDVVRHVDVTAFDARPLMDSYRDMAFQARNLAAGLTALGVPVLFVTRRSGRELGAADRQTGEECPEGH